MPWSILLHQSDVDTGAETGLYEGWLEVDWNVAPYTLTAHRPVAPEISDPYPHYVRLGDRLEAPKWRQLTRNFLWLREAVGLNGLVWAIVFVCSLHPTVSRAVNSVPVLIFVPLVAGIVAAAASDYIITSCGLSPLYFWEGDTTFGVLAVVLGPFWLGIGYAIRVVSKRGRNV